MEISKGNNWNIIPPGQDITLTVAGQTVQGPAMYFVVALLQLLGPQELAFICRQVDGLVKSSLTGKAITGNGQNGQIIIR